MARDTIANAQGHWREILCHFGISLPATPLRHGPCPMCEGKTRFRFDDKEGHGTWICSHCGAGKGMALLMAAKRWDFRHAAREVDAIIGNLTPAKQERANPSNQRFRLRRIAAGLQRVTQGDPVSLYLEGRGIGAAPCDALRLHPGLSYFDDEGKLVGEWPAMVSLIEGPDGTRMGYSVTYLTADGDKAPVSMPKKMLKAVESLTGGASRLWPVQDHIGIAEGIETARGVFQRFGQPCYAAHTAVLLSQWQPPAGVKRVSIWGDNDLSATGQQAAYTLARRMYQRGIDFSVHIPTDPGTDWADGLEKKRMADTPQPEGFGLRKAAD